MTLPLRQIFLIVLCFKVFLLPAQTGQLKFRYLTNEDGLTQNSGRSIIQDSRGFIWIATEIGLNRYDGYNIVTYTHNPSDTNSITNNYLNVIYEDSRGNILVGTDGKGLNYLDIEKNKFINYLHDPDNPNSLCDNYIFSIFEDRDSMIWIGTKNGINKLCLKDNSITRYIMPVTEPSDSIYNNIIRAVCEDSNGKLWVGTLAGLNRFEKEKGQFRKIPGVKTVILDMFPDSQGVICITSPVDGLITFDIKKEKTIKDPLIEKEIYTLTANRISKSVKDKHGNLWIAAMDSGLVYFDRKNKKFIRYTHNRLVPNSLTSNSIKNIYLDKAGILWVGTYYDGVNYYDTEAKPFNHYITDREEKHFFNSLGPITKDSEGNIWFGSLNGLFRYNEPDNTVVKYTQEVNDPKGLTDNFVTVLMEDKDGLVWIGTDSGLNCYDPDRDIFSKYLADPDDPEAMTDQSIWALYEDSKGNIWTGTWGGGINIYNKNIGKFSHLMNDPANPNSLSENNVIYFHEDNEGFMWIGTWEGGLNRYDPENKKFTIFRHDKYDANSLGHDIVAVIHEDHDGLFWIGTFGGGLDRFDRKTGSFTHYTEKDGLSNNTILGILEDDHRNLWISTNRGISKFNIDTKKFQNYNITDGVQSNEFSQHGFAGTKDGKFLFSGSNGFNYFHPDSISASEYKPPVLITEFRIGTETVLPEDSTFLIKPIYMTREIYLSYRENIFSFGFTSLHMAYPEKIQYAYMMQGFDKDWNYVGNERSARFTNLNPGEYIFMVKATNCDGVWNNTPVSIKVFISPPFWKTTWFYIVVTVTGMLLIYMVMKLREYKLMRDKRILEEKVVERTAMINEQKEEITAQRDEILMRNEEIMQQKEEIEAQRDFVMMQGDKIANQKERIQKQRDMVVRQKQEITDSILYAKRIQTALLPPEEYIKKYLPEHFILFKPRDIVSGDFYWAMEKENELVIAASDCTGHGVPGAFMSMLGVAFMNEIVSRHDKIRADELLNHLRDQVITSLRQRGSDDNNTDNTINNIREKPTGEPAKITGTKNFEENVKDGMDIALCIIDPQKKKMQYSGANNPLYIIRKNNSVPEMEEIKADRMPIGIHVRADQMFTNHEISLSKGDSVYIFSDGFPDQFGGQDEETRKAGGKKFKYSRFKKLLLEINNLDMAEQKTILEKTLKDWKGELEQVDDIIIIGMRI